MLLFRLAGGGCGRQVDADHDAATLPLEPLPPAVAAGEGRAAAVCRELAVRLTSLSVFVAGCVAALHRIRDDTGGSKASAAHGLPTLPKPHVAKALII